MPEAPERLDAGRPALRVIGAAVYVTGIVIVTLTNVVQPQWTLAAWIIIPLACAAYIVLGFAGAPRMRPGPATV